MEDAREPHDGKVSTATPPVPDGQDNDPRKGRMVASLLLSGSLALGGCSASSPAGTQGDPVEPPVDNPPIQDSELPADTGPDVPDVAPDPADVPSDTPQIPEVGPDAVEPPPEKLDIPDLPPLDIADPGEIPAATLCTIDEKAPGLALKPTKLKYPSGEDIVFVATAMEDLNGFEHELSVAVETPSMVKKMVKTGEGTWEIAVHPFQDVFGPQSYTLTATLKVHCADKVREYQQKAFFCFSFDQGFIITDKPYSQECSMVCDPMPPPPDTECPGAFKGGVTLTPAKDSVWGFELLELTAKLDPKYLDKQGWSEPVVMASTGKVKKVEYVGPGIYRILWSRFDGDCKDASGTTGKIWVEWPVQCMDGGWPDTGYIYAEVHVCVGAMNDVHVIKEGESCPIILDPMPPPPCPDSVMTVKTDKTVFNVAEPLAVSIQVDDVFLRSQEMLSVETDFGSITGLVRDCEAGTVDFKWKMPLSIGSEKAGATITAKIKVSCSVGGNEWGEPKEYEQEVRLCIQPDGSILVNPQVCSILPLSLPVYARIVPLRKSGLDVELSCEDNLDLDADVRYRWTVTAGALSSREGKKVSWKVPSRTGSYLVQAFAVKGDEGVGADAVTVNVFAGKVRSIHRV